MILKTIKLLLDISMILSFILLELTSILYIFQYKQFILITNNLLEIHYNGVNVPDKQFMIQCTSINCQWCHLCPRNSLLIYYYTHIIKHMSCFQKSTLEKSYFHGKKVLFAYTIMHNFYRKKLKQKENSKNNGWK